jgi:hypothetical protein
MAIIRRFGAARNYLDVEQRSLIHWLDGSGVFVARTHKPSAEARKLKLFEAKDRFIFPLFLIPGGWVFKNQYVGLIS